MSIRDLFRQTSNTVADLQEKYKSIDSQKKSLETKADSLRAESLKTDADVSVEIDEIKEELSLADIALREIKADLETMLSKKIADDYSELAGQQLEFQTKQSDLSQKAGRELGQAIKSLQSMRLAFASTIERSIREHIIELSNDHRRQNQMTEFLSSYGDAINSQSDGIDLRAWKKRLQKVEGLQPGTPDAERHVEAKVRQLISAN